MGRRRPSYLFLYFFCVVLLRSASLADDYEDEEESVVFEPPLLFPEDPELIISSGETVQLRCESKRPIKWTIPKYKIIDKEGLPDISVNFTRNAASEYSYVSHLQVYNAETLDTGYYYCRFAENSNLAAVEEVASVYVYVNDSNILLASNARSSFIHLTPIQYQEVTLPCKPTSPDVIVNLEKDNEIVEQDSFKKYDPKLGFKFSHVNINDGGFYSCNAFRGDITEKLTISLKVLPHTNTVPKPQIDDKNAIHVGVGSDFLLNCTVQMELSVIFNLEWVTPNQHANETGRLEIGDAESTRMKYFNYEYNLGSKQLMVHNATSEDQGYYKCIVVDHTHKNNSAERFVRIYEANITYINLTVQGNVSEISTKAGKKSIQWVVHINAHPSPELTWFGPREKEIHNISTKYEIQTGPTQTMLKINDIDIDDAGQYQLRAIQGERKVVKNLTLIVYDSPIADLISPMYYTYGEIHKVNCSVIGYPLPNVTWHFKGCGNSFQNCDMKDSIIEESQYEEIQLNGKGKKSYFLEIRANESGYLTCLACNSVGCGNDTKEVFVTDVQDGFDSFVIPPEPVVGDNVTLSCGASVYNYTDPISWYKYNPKDDVYENITTNEVYKVIQHTTQFSRKVDIQINKINMTHAGIYVCKVPKISDDYKVEEKHVNVTVQKIHSPVFWKSNMNGSTYYVDIGAKVEWKCSVKGVPKPLIIWYKDDEPLQVEKSNMELSKDNQTLKITFANVKDKGKYSCKVSNKGGRIEGSVYLEFNHKTDYGLLIGFLVFGTFLSVVIIFLILKNNKEKKKRKELMYAGLANFEDGALENINPELGVDDQAELLPYDKKWEFPREKLKLGKQLGSGAFGVVMKGDACGIVEGEAVTTVAVKMVKRNAEYTHIKALASELKIMVHLGKHLNVVNLLGACTKNLTKRELLVIVEYCRFGNLQNYLLRHREDFIDQIDPITGKVIPDIMDNKRHSDTSISKAREAGKADPRIKYAALSFSTSASSLASQGSVQDYRAAPVVKVDSSPCNGATGQTLNTDMSFVSMSPSGEECGVTGGSSNEPDWRTNYRGDYGRRDVRPICTTDLICWAFQVARGIDYLASRRVLHGDLAARNILLAEDNIVKICDFGLAKSMYKTDNYKKKGDGPLPVKWMAIESIRDRVFSTQSDVWSFGIVLWEFFSLARTPYPGMEADEKLYNKLIAGYRMEKPQFATEEIYTVMQDCWKAKPSDRPSFSELTEKLGGMLEDSVKRHYIELNSPYMMMNTQQPETTDYLGMMSEPSYANAMREITTDSPQRDYVNAPKQPENAAMDYMTMNSPEPPSEDGAESESGYLCMRSGSMGSGGNPTVIFSPRPNSTKAFDFDVPSSRNPSRLSPRIRAAETKGAEGPELSPMLPANNINKGAMLIKEDSLDSGVGSPSSYFNPTYRSLPNTNGNLAQNNENSGINYVNIPQSKARQSDISSGFQSDGEVSPLPVKNSSSFEMPMEIAT